MNSIYAAYNFNDFEDWTKNECNISVEVEAFLTFEILVFRASTSVPAAKFLALLTADLEF